MPEWLTQAAGLVAAAGVIIGPILVYRAGSRTSRAASEEAHLARQDKELSSLRERIENLEKRERLRDDYINKLRKHISDGNPPPPPDWPDELT